METTEISEEKLYKAMKHSICSRAMLMHLLLTCYTLFDSIQTKKRCMETNITYNDAEEIANIFGEIAGRDISPTQLLFDKNQLANELLEEYQELQSLMNTKLDDIMRPIANAYFHHLFYYRKVSPIDVIRPVLVGVSAFLNYAVGRIDKEELRNSMIAFDLGNIKTVVIDSKYIRYNFLKLEEDFNDICNKRASRILKKAGKDPNNPFTIHMSL